MVNKVSDQFLESRRGTEEWENIKESDSLHISFVVVAVWRRPAVGVAPAASCTWTAFSLKDVIPPCSDLKMVREVTYLFREIGMDAEEGFEVGYVGHVAYE